LGTINIKAKRKRKKRKKEGKGGGRKKKEKEKGTKMNGQCSGKWFSAINFQIKKGGEVQFPAQPSSGREKQMSFHNNE
jgi:hypothetical protein